MLGGTQSLHCNGLDEALGLPTESAAQIALRTQQIIASETGVIKTVDPVGGSWAIETLTTKIEKEAEKIISEIDDLGGALPAIETGFIQHEIQESAYQSQKAIDSGESVVVGVNQYSTTDPTPLETLKIDPSLENEQINRLNKMKASRDELACQNHLKAVEMAAQTESNLVQPIISAVEAHATVGEVADVLRKVFGEYTEQS